MLTIDSVPILVPVRTILNELSIDLKSRGKSGLRFGKQTGTDIMLSCPLGVHSDKKPSAGINLHNGVFHCFACGASYSLPRLISVLLYDTEIVLQGETYLLDKFADYTVEHRETAFKLPKRGTKAPKKIHYVSEEELDRYAFYHSYILNRGISKEVVDLFDVGYDKDRQAITFPVKDSQGKCLFIARRSVKGKEFNYPLGAEKPLYGLDVLAKYGKLSNPLYITESMINCLSLWTHGFQAVALNGTGSSEQIAMLKELPYRRLVLGLDGDNAGRKGTVRLYEALKKFKLMTRLNLEDGVDINDILMYNKDTFREIILRSEERV